MKKIKVHIDFDDTMVCSSERMVEMLNKRFNMHQNWRNIQKYSAIDLFPQSTQDDINWVFGNKAFFNHKLKLIPNVEEVLSKFEDYFEYEIVTMGIPDNLKYKEIWCADNLSFRYKFVGISDFVNKKSLIDMSGGVMIDDNTEVLANTNASHKLLITNERETDWNQVHPIFHKDIITIENWNGIGEYLETELLGVRKNEKSYINIR